MQMQLHQANLEATTSKEQVQALLGSLAILHAQMDEVKTLHTAEKKKRKRASNKKSNQSPVAQSLAENDSFFLSGLSFLLFCELILMLAS